MQLKIKENWQDNKQDLLIEGKKIIFYTELSEKILKENNGDLSDLFEEDDIDDILDEYTIVHYRKVINQLLKNNFRICFTIPKKYLSDLLKHGLKPHSENTFDKKNILAGTIGRKLYLPKTENDGRYIAIFKNPQNIDLYDIIPRLTGIDHSFHGVISTNKAIPLKEFIIVDSENYEIIYPKNEKTINPNIIINSNIMDIREATRNKLNHNLSSTV